MIVRSRLASSTLQPRKKPATKRVRGNRKIRSGASTCAPAAVQHRDPVAHGERLLLIVRHVDEGGPGRLLDLGQLALHLAADLLIQRGERLVEQQQLRARRQRAASPPAAARRPRAG